MKNYSLATLGLGRKADETSFTHSDTPSINCMNRFLIQILHCIAFTRQYHSSTQIFNALRQGNSSDRCKVGNKIEGSMPPLIPPHVEVSAVLFCGH